MMRGAQPEAQPQQVVICQKCESQNQAGQKFCGNCGTSLMPVRTVKCPYCQAENPETMKFCGNCGAPVEASEALPDDAQERFGDETVIAEAPVIPPLEPQESEFAPPPPPPPPVAGAGGEGKKKTGMIIAIVVIAVILLCCCCVAAVYIFLNLDAGQDLLRELDLAMRPLLMTLVV